MDRALLGGHPTEPIALLVGLMKPILKLGTLRS